MDSRPKVIVERYADGVLHTHTHACAHTRAHTQGSCFKDAVSIFIWWRVISVTDREWNWGKVGTWEKILVPVLRLDSIVCQRIFPSGCPLISTPDSDCCRTNPFFFFEKVLGLPFSWTFCAQFPTTHWVSRGNLISVCLLFGAMPLYTHRWSDCSITVSVVQEVVSRTTHCLLWCNY